MCNSGCEGGERAELIGPRSSGFSGRESGIACLEASEEAADEIGDEERGEEEGDGHAFEVETVGGTADFSDAARTFEWEALKVDKEVTERGQSHDGGQTLWTQGHGGECHEDEEEGGEWIGGTACEIDQGRQEQDVPSDDGCERAFAAVPKGFGEELQEDVGESGEGNDREQGQPGQVEFEEDTSDEDGCDLSRHTDPAQAEQPAQGDIGDGGNSGSEHGGLKAIL